PFSPESSPVRKEATELFARVLEGSDVKVPKDLAAELPHLLWLYHMGITLFWIHDTSPGARRTRTLVDHTVEIVARLVTVARVPVLRPLRRRLLLLIEALRKESA